MKDSYRNNERQIYEDIIEEEIKNTLKLKHQMKSS